MTRHWRKDMGNNITMLPSERNAIRIAILKEIQSDSTKRNFDSVHTIKDLQDAANHLATEIENRIADIGFIAKVSRDILSADNFDMYDGDRIEWHPQVTIVSRIVDKETDFDRMQYEVKAGIAD